MEILNNKYEVKYIDQRYRRKNIRAVKKETEEVIMSFFRVSSFGDRDYIGYYLKSELKEIEEFKDNNIMCFFIMSLIDCFKNIDCTNEKEYKKEEEKYNKIFDNIKEIIIKENK